MFTAAGKSAAVSAANYIEGVFSTYLYTGNNTSQTITNNVDLSTYGGMVWIKSRSGTYPTGYNVVNDTVRGAQKDLYTNTTGAQSTNTQGLTSFSSTGFSVGNTTDVNGGTTNLVSWTFRKQAKFFDVVTYTGNGVAGRTVAHSLGSVPGCIIVKSTSNANNWAVYHRSTGNTQWLQLNATDAAAALTGAWNNTTPDASVFTVGNSTATNQNGTTYVAYLFAHDAGGFGAAGTDNVISCGSFYTGATNQATITLGWEPQWVLIKNQNSVSDWWIVDNMRGMPVNDSSTIDAMLRPNTSGAETSSAYLFIPTATGFYLNGSGVYSNNSTYIYIAIRRGPMKTPTSGTSVFSPITTNTTAGTKQTTNFPIDLQINRYRRTATTGSAAGTFAIDRLRGVSTNSTAVAQGLQTNNATAENDYPADLSLFWDSVGFQVTSLADLESSVWWSFRRAPGFFDVVCYTGTGVARTVTHNLGVAPELMIGKSRSQAGSVWFVYASPLGATNYLRLDSTAASATGTNVWNNTAPTSSVFTVGTQSDLNANNATQVMYLFATVAGVSKVGSYTGTGTTKQVDCGFTAGSRFVMIKRTDSTGDWYVWDSARGIVAGNDPYLLLNSTAAEVTTTDYVDTYNAGFEISSTAPAGINASGGTYIFLAIA